MPAMKDIQAGAVNGGHAEPVIDAEVVESTAVDVYHAPPAALFKTDDPVEVVEQASRVANALAAVIDQRQLFTMIQGKKHVQVEGWQLLGVMLGVTAVCVATEPVDGGYKATVEARTADGRVIGRADALCTKTEKRGPWKSADDYARLSMAQTRATSKALKGPLGFVVSLAGYATTPAEEMTFAEADHAPTATPPEPEPVLLPDASVKVVLDAIKAAAMGAEWVRSQLVAIGAEHVPDGPLVKGTIQRLTPEQAVELTKLCSAAAEAKA